MTLRHYTMLDFTSVPADLTHLQMFLFAEVTIYNGINS